MVRIKIYEGFKTFKHRILVATEIFGRGIDIEKINIVFNFDMPKESDSYLHRVGRAGRFGTKGLAITFVETDEDKKVLQEIQERFEVKIGELPATIDATSYMNNWRVWRQQGLESDKLKVVLHAYASATTSLC